MSFLFHVTLPGDADLLEPLRELTQRVVRYAGYGKNDGRELATTITEGAAEAMRQAAGGPAAIDLRFEADDARFEVTLSYAGPAGTDGAPSLRSFECGREGGRRVCRMARSLPVEPSS